MIAVTLLLGRPISSQGGAVGGSLSEIAGGTDDDLW